MKKTAMIKKTLVTLLLSSFAVAAGAHQVWLERDGAGPAKVYVGDVDGERDHGDDVAKLASTIQVFGKDGKQPAAISNKDAYLEAAVGGAGDVRLIADQVWKPWKNKEGQLQAAVFNSRAGRIETAAALDFELVPVKANGNVFTLTFKGAPVADKKVSIVNPEKWVKAFTTDQQGRIAVPVQGKGRYILMSSHDNVGEVEIAGEKVQKVSYTTTLSFVAK